MIYIISFIALGLYGYKYILDAVISHQKGTINTLTNALSEANQNLECERIRTKCQQVIISEQKKIIDRLCAAVDDYVDKVESADIQAWAKKIQENG